MGFKFTSEYRYQQLIMVGLIFSCAGDALLDYKKENLFQYGMLAFAGAQIFYISAFGWKPFRIFIGLVLYVFGGVGEKISLHDLTFKNSHKIILPAVSIMFKNFEGILIFGVPIYCALLLTMAWRANARLQCVENLPKLLAGLGAVFFVASDALIAFDMFYAPIKYSKILIISTYYIAQLGITLSILDYDVMPKSSLKSN